jgi:DNA-directed RNA polymerase subunit RPC12/RpoP
MRIEWLHVRTLVRGQDSAHLWGYQHEWMCLKCGAIVYSKTMAHRETACIDCAHRRVQRELRADVALFYDAGIDPWDEQG